MRTLHPNNTPTSILTQGLDNMNAQPGLTNGAMAFIQSAGGAVAANYYLDIIPVWIGGLLTACPFIP